MKFEALFLFLIILLGLVLYSFLGGKYNKENFTGTFDIELNKQNQPSSSNNSSGSSGSSTSGTNNNSSGSSGSSSSSGTSNNSSNYDNYNHYSGSSSPLQNGSTFYDQNGGSVQVKMQSNGQPTLSITTAQGQQPMIFTTNPPSSSSNTTSNSISNPFSSVFGNSNNSNTTTSEGYTNFNSSTSGSNSLKFYGPNGGTALVINHNGQRAIKVDTNGGSYLYISSNPSSLSSSNQYSSPYNPNYTTYNNTPSTYYGSTGVIGSNINNNNKAYQGGSSMTSMSYPSSSSSSSSSSYNYSNSLPQGVPRSQIPPGQEDLYILKSEIVPPVCPACPTSAACPREEKCPPCPACARCPEPAFECKKVPNYNSINEEYLPVPVLNDFSTFGM
jgi:hypothetical protein